jgi:acyl transferase domain-containing protein
MAIAGGINVMLAPELSITFSKAHMLCPDGRCKTFDAAANGYVRGEGVGIVVLKRLSDAESAGDRILAVLRGSAVNQDGPSSGLTVPNGPSQQEVIRRALAIGEIPPEEVSYLEAHGTGTALGDPIEMGAVGAVFGNRTEPLWVGSVKTNVGHLEGAAGIAGVIKVVLALGHEQIPPHLHFNTPSPRIPWNGLPVRIPTQSTPWPRRGRRRLAGVSSFGFSGINAHVILEEPPAAEKETKPERPWHVLPLSAKHPQVLRTLAGRYAAHLRDTRSPRLSDICFTAAAGRSHFEHRAAVVAKTATEARQRLEALARGERIEGLHSDGAEIEPPKVVFLFSGQGSQQVGMGRELYEVEPTFRAAFDQCEEVLREHLDRPLREIVFADSSDGSQLDNTGYTQPALFALQYSLALLWQSWGVRPAALIGHSLGDYSAACLAGVFNLEDALKLVVARGRLGQELLQNGRMVAVFAGEERVGEALADREDAVSIAAVNSPHQVVISGLAEAVDEVVAELNSDGVSARPLKVSRAFHSPLVEPVLGEFRRVAETVSYASPRMELISNLSGRSATEEMARPEYWCTQVRQPVRFFQGMKHLVEVGMRTFLEVGPQPTLLGLARECWEAAPGEGTPRWLSSLVPGRSNFETLLAALAELYVAGQAVDWEQFSCHFAGRKIPLPTYAFQRRRFWIEASGAGLPEYRVASDSSVHPLLGRQLHSAAVGDLVQFEGVLSSEQPAYLRDHRVGTTSVLPASAYMEFALAAARQVDQRGNTVVEGIALEQAMAFPEGLSRVVQVAIKPEESGRRFELYSRFLEDGTEGYPPQWTLHATGQLAAAVEADSGGDVDLDELKGRCSEELPLAGFYEQMKQYGLEYGPAFRGLKRLWRGQQEVLGKVELPQELASDALEYLLYPPLLDACLHVTAQLIDPRVRSERNVGATFVPVGVDRLRLFASASTNLWSYARLKEGPDEAGAGRYTIDVDLINPEGTLVARLEGLRAQQVDLSMLVPQAPDQAGRPQGKGGPPPRDLAGELRGQPAGVRRQRITEFLEEEVIKLLKLPRDEQPAHHKSLFELGMDSLMAVEFLYRVNWGLKINLPMPKLLANAAIAPLADELVAELAASEGGPQAKDGSAVQPPSIPAAAPEPAAQSVWFPGHRTEPNARMRLFCFHPPGGQASVYSGWPDLLRPDIEVCAIQLPGSGTREDEKPIPTWPSLVESVADEMLDYLDRPFAFFGYGAGSLLAYDVAYVARERFGLSPAHLFVATTWAPEDVEAKRQPQAAPAQATVAHQSESAGDSDGLGSPDDHDKAHLAGFRIYRFTPRPPLDCSVTAFAARSDEQFTREDLHRWYACTQAGFRLELLSATFAAQLEDPTLLLEIVAQDLRQAVDR